MFFSIAHQVFFHDNLQSVCDKLLEESARLTDVVPSKFDESAGVILCAVHELFSATHPQTASFYARAHGFCRLAQAALDTLEPPDSASEMLTRHLILDRAFKAVRRETKVNWWSGQGTWHGEEPPSYFLWWPTVRRIEVEKNIRPMWQSALEDGDEETRRARRDLLIRFLGISPLSCVLYLGQNVLRQLYISPLDHLSDVGLHVIPLTLVEDPNFARLGVDTWLETGVERSGSDLAFALHRALEERRRPVLAYRRAVEICVHLTWMLCFIEADNPGSKESAALRSFFDEEIDQMNEKFLLFWVVVCAADLIEDDLLPLPLPSSFSPDVQALWRALKERWEHPRIKATAKDLSHRIIFTLDQLAAENS